MQVGNRFQAVQVINGPENAIDQNDYLRMLGNAIIEKAASDLRKCMKKDIKHHLYSWASYDSHSILKTSSIAYFFSSPLSKLLCGTINPWYIVEKIADEMCYPYKEQLREDYERGDD